MWAVKPDLGTMVGRFRMIWGPFGGHLNLGGGASGGHLEGIRESYWQLLRVILRFCHELAKQGFAFDDTGTIQHSFSRRFRF